MGVAVEVVQQVQLAAKMAETLLSDTHPPERREGEEGGRRGEEGIGR